MSTQATLSIGGMTCGTCSNAIEKLLKPLKGIDDASVSLVLNSCITTFDEDIISIEAIMDEIEDIGFDASLISIRKSSLLPQSTTAPKSKYHIRSNPTKKTDMIVWSARISKAIQSDENDVKLDESYLYDILHPIAGIIEIRYDPMITELQITFNKHAILPMSITHLVESHLLRVDEVQLSPKYEGYKDDKTCSEMKNISFVARSLNKSFTTMKAKQLKEAFCGHITWIELDMESHCLYCEYYNSNEAPHMARDIYKYLKHEMNFHDIDCVDRVRYEHDLYYIEQQRKVSKLKDAFVMSCFFGIPCLMIALVLPHNTLIHDHLLMHPIIPGNNSVTLMGVAMFFLATPVQFWVGAPFYVSAWRAAKRKTSNMSTLIVLGTSMAWLYSVIALLVAWWTPHDHPSMPLHEGAHFFETSSTVIMIVLLGKWLGAKAKYKTCDAIGMLMDIQSSAAYLIEVDALGRVHSRDEDISTELIVVDDIVRVCSGDRIPLDGSVVYGTSSIDESMITGESIPRNVTIGDAVISSSINCGDHMILVRVDRNKANSVISKVIELMRRSPMTKPKQQEFADTVSSYFVPLVICLSAITFVVWYAACLMGYVPYEWYKQDKNAEFFAILFAMAVMVIACPCALGLATPTAVMVGMGVASKYGCVIKGGNVLELAYNVDVLVFDKTGTLTFGKPKVIDLVQFSTANISRQQLLFYLGSAELNSQHPLAKAIVSFAQHELHHTLHLVSPSSCCPIPGKGIRAVVDGHTVAIGNYEWFCSKWSELRLPQGVTRDDIESMLFVRNDSGHITLLISIDNDLLSYLCLFDAPRPESKALVHELTNKYNIQCVMLTGDNDATARAIAQQIGINPMNVISQVLPQEKHQVIRDLQCGQCELNMKQSQKGKYVAVSTMEVSDEYKYRVGMVGDGINDAAALAQADFGIAIGNGTDIAIEAADCILMNDNLWNIATLLDLSKTIMHRIYLNFVFSFGFNVLAIPIAAGVLYPSFRFRLPPECASIAMACSSLCVLISSIALKWYKSPYQKNHAQLI
eukprot:703368_1